jgi:hypothetical protein
MGQTAVALREGGGAMGLLIFLRGAVEAFKNDLGTLRSSDPNDLLDIPMVT